MPHTQTRTSCVVRLVPLRGPSPATRAQCQAPRAEVGRLWTDLVTLHAQARTQGRWLSAGELEQATKGGQYALQSQSVPALCQKFAATVDTAMELRRQERAKTGHIQAASPHHPKVYQTVIWKDQALQIQPDGRLRLPTGGQRLPLVLPLPAEYRAANLRRVELTWRADHDNLCLTIDTGRRCHLRHSRGSRPTRARLPAPRHASRHRVSRQRRFRGRRTTGRHSRRATRRWRAACRTRRRRCGPRCR